MPKFESVPQPVPKSETHTIHNPFLSPAVVEKRHKAASRIGGDLYEAIENGIPREVTSRWSGKTETYYPSLIGRGGEHLVFDFDDPKHADVVFKVNYFKSADVLRAWFRGQSQLKAAVEFLQDDIAEQKTYLMELRKYFGKEAVPVQRLAVRDVPISREVIEQLDPRYASAKCLPDHLPAWIAVQSKIELANGEAVSVHGSYAESAVAHASETHLLDVQDEYDRAHDVLAGYQEAGAEPLDREGKVGRVLEMFHGLRPIYARAEEDPGFKAKLQEVVRDLLQYTRETGNALDLNGENNLVLVQQDGAWQFKLLDPLFSGEQFKMSDLEYAAEELTLDEALHPHVSGKALNPLNTFRVINALALIADVPDRLTVPHMTEISPRRWRENLISRFEQT